MQQVKLDAILLSVGAYEEKRFGWPSPPTLWKLPAGNFLHIFHFPQSGGSKKGKGSIQLEEDAPRDRDTVQVNSAISLPGEINTLIECVIM